LNNVLNGAVIMRSASGAVGYFSFSSNMPALSQGKEVKKTVTK
jgi:hypothetical protein